MLLLYFPCCVHVHASIVQLHLTFTTFLKFKECKTLTLLYIKLSFPYSFYFITFLYIKLSFSYSFYFSEGVPTSFIFTMTMQIKNCCQSKMLHLNLFNVLMLPCKRSVVCLKIFCWVWSHTKYHGFFFCSHLWRAYLNALSMDFTTHLKLQRGLCSSLVFWTIFTANLFWLPPKRSK